MESVAGLKTSRDECLRFYARWRQTQNRYERLQTAFDNDARMNAAIEHGRYLRLCAQIALASEAAEDARKKFVTALSAIDH